MAEAFEALRADIPKAVHLAEREQYILLMFMRGLSLYNAIRTLVQADMVDEPLILARPLYEESLRLSDLAASKHERESLIVGWQLQSLDYIVKIQHALQATGHAVDFTSVQERRDSLAADARTEGIRAKRRSVEELVRTHGLPDEAVMWQLAHQQVHGSLIALFGHRPGATEDGMQFNLISPRPTQAKNVVMYATKSIVRARVAMSDIFGWPVINEEALLDVLRGIPVPPD